MTYIIYLFPGTRKVLENVASIFASKRTVKFRFSDGFELRVLKKYLLHYQLLESKAIANTKSVQELFNKFDDFVDNFINSVELSMQNHKYTISIQEVKQFKNLVNGYNE